MTFNGFISYSHAADGRLAPAVQHGLHRLAKPWHRRRALWIFRDQTGLSVTPGLWSSIQTALDGSDYFVLLASPEAARSQWVNREIEHWIATKSANQILPVVTDGEWEWDPEKRDFTEASTAVPATLRGVFSEEPLFLDLRWARGTEHLSLQHSRFRDAIAQLAAPMHGVSKDELEGEDVRQHRRARRLRSGAAATLAVLTVLAVGAGMSSVRNAERARNNAEEALRQQRVAEEQRGSAERFQLESRQQQELAQQQQARATDAAAEADRSERVARERQKAADQAEGEARRQQRLADKASAEARRQQRLADQAATRTREQQQRAREATERARVAAARAQREQREAQRLAKIADVQRRLAREAAAEAKKQRAKADQQQRIAVSRRLINQARAAVDRDPRTALMLGTAAQRIQPDAETRGELAGVVTATNFAGSLADVTAARYLPDGVLAARGSDGVLSFWNVADRRNPVRITSLPEPVDGFPLFSRDGRTMAVSGAGHTVVLWNVADRFHPVRLGALPGDNRVGAISANGAILVTYSGTEDLTVWGRADPARPTPLAVISYPVLGGLPPILPQELTISPDGTALIVDLGSTVEVYDLTEPADPVMARRWGRELSGASMVFSPDGRTLAVGSDQGRVGLFETARLLEPLPPPPPPAPPVPPEPGEPPHPLPPPWPDFADDPFEFGTALDGLAGTVGALAFSADGHLLAAGDASGTVLVWNDLTLVTSMRTFSRINWLSFDPKADTLAGVDSSAKATLWGLPPLGTPSRFAALDVPGGSARATAFLSDGRALLVAGSDGVAKSWNVTDPAHPDRAADLTVYPGKTTAVAFSPDRRTVAAVGNGQLILTDLSRPASPLRHTTRIEQLRDAARMAFAADGRTIAVVGSSGLTLLNVADPARPTVRATLGGGSAFGSLIALSPDGRILASGNGKTMTLWNVAEASVPVRLATLSGHSDRVAVLGFSPDGRTLASGSADSTVMLWDVADPVHPQQVATLSGPGGDPASIAFSADGRTLAAGTTSDAVTLWDTGNPSIPLRLATTRTGLAGSATGVVFASDGRTLAVSSQYGSKATVTLWNYTKLNNVRANPVKYACAITGRGLTAGEWARHIPELPYRRTCND